MVFCFLEAMFGLSWPMTTRFDSKSRYKQAVGRMQNELFIPNGLLRFSLDVLLTWRYLIDAL